MSLISISPSFLRATNDYTLKKLDCGSLKLDFMIFKADTVLFDRLRNLAHIGFMDFLSMLDLDLIKRCMIF